VLTIQLRDIASDGSIDPDRLARVELDELADRYFVRAGDVVFRSRGERNTATALDDRFLEPAVAVLPLIVLRPRPEVVTAEYLAWAINQPGAQRHFDTTARGTSMRMVPKSSLDELHIDIPNIATQRQIVEIDALAERERGLAILVAEKRRRLTSLILGEQAKSIRPGPNSQRIKK
jgi:restriction endonuclease S subunit